MILVEVALGGGLLAALSWCVSFERRLRGQERLDPELLLASLRSELQQRGESQREAAQNHALLHPEDPLDGLLREIRSVRTELEPLDRSTASRARLIFETMTPSEQRELYHEHLSRRRGALLTANLPADEESALTNSYQYERELRAQQERARQTPGVLTQEALDAEREHVLSLDLGAVLSRAPRALGNESVLRVRAALANLRTVAAEARERGEVTRETFTPARDPDFFVPAPLQGIDRIPAPGEPEYSIEQDPRLRNQEATRREAWLREQIGLTEVQPFPEDIDFVRTNRNAIRGIASTYIDPSYVTSPYTRIPMTGFSLLRPPSEGLLGPRLTPLTDGGEDGDDAQVWTQIHHPCTLDAPCGCCDGAPAPCPCREETYRRLEGKRLLLEAPVHAWERLFEE